MTDPASLEQRRASGREDEGRRRGGGGAGEVSKWEWATAALGLLLVLGTVGFLLYEAFGRTSTPPALEVRADSVVATGSGYVVALRIRNQGGTTAAGVQIEGELKSGDSTVEKASAQVPYVPARGSRGAGLIFRNDPTPHRLEVRAVGYELP